MRNEEMSDQTYIVHVVLEVWAASFLLDGLLSGPGHSLAILARPHVAGLEPLQTTLAVESPHILRQLRVIILEARLLRRTIRL